MGSVLRSFGAFQGNVSSVAPFIPVGPGENQWKNTKNEISPTQPNRTGWKSKYVLPYMPSNSTQLGANGKFLVDGILRGRGANGNNDENAEKETWQSKWLREAPAQEKHGSNGLCPNSVSTPPPSSKRTLCGSYFRRKSVNFWKQRFWLWKWIFWRLLWSNFVLRLYSDGYHDI